MADEDERGPSVFTLAEQIECVRRELERREIILDDWIERVGVYRVPPPVFRGTKLMRAVLHTLQAMIDDGK